MSQIKRGDVYFAELSPIVGCEQGGFHPVLVIQNDVGNKFSPTIIVIPLTKQSKSKIPTHVQIYGFSNESFALCEQIKTIDKTRLGGFLCSIDERQMDNINKGIALSIGLAS